MDTSPVSQRCVYIIEPQGLLLEPLMNLFASLDIPVGHVSADIDESYLRRHHPSLIFLDSDYLSDGLLDGLRRIGEASERSRVVVFCARWSQTESLVQTTPRVEVVIPKNSRTQTMRLLLSQAYAKTQG